MRAMLKIALYEKQQGEHKKLIELKELCLFYKNNKCAHEFTEERCTGFCDSLLPRFTPELTNKIINSIKDTKNIGISIDYGKGKYGDIINIVRLCHHFNDPDCVVKMREHDFKQPLLTDLLDLSPEELRKHYEKNPLPAPDAFYCSGFCKDFDINHTEAIKAIRNFLMDENYKKFRTPKKTPQKV